MAKKKAEAANQPKAEVVFEEGDWCWQVARGTPGNYTTGWAKGKYKATIKGDPEGCRGFGKTKEKAQEMLFKYAFGNWAAPDLE